MNRSEKLLQSRLDRLLGSHYHKLTCEEIATLRLRPDHKAVNAIARRIGMVPLCKL